MLTQFNWPEARVWTQRLQSCNDLRVHPETNIYPFPLEEVLYQLLLHAELEEPADSMNHLQMLWRRYHDEHSDFSFSVDELTEEGWLDSFCRRWSLVWHVRQDQIEATEDGQLREILKFLLWLEEQTHEDCSALYLDDWEGHLTRLRAVYPELPDEKWFIDQHILHKDRRHFCSISYRRDQEYFFRALARLWRKTDTPERQRQWAEMAFQLGATADLLARFPQADWHAILELLAERMLSGKIPTAAEENKRIGRNYMLKSGKIQLHVPYPGQLSDEDSTQNLARAQREIWEEGPYFWHRNAIRSFEVAAVTEHISFVPENKRQDVLARLKKLHHLGILNLLHPFPADATLQLLEYPETQFMALHTLAQLHQEQYRKGNAAAGECILAWITYTMQEGKWQETEPLSKLLSYLSEFAYRGTEQQRPEAELLSAILQQLSRFCFSRTEFLSLLTKQIIQSTERIKGITWCRRIQLLANWAQRLKQAIPEEQRLASGLLVPLYDCLRQSLRRLLQTPFNRDAAFVPPALLEQPVWVESYVLADAGTQKWMRNPVLPWYTEPDPTTEDKFHARYQFRIGLSWLTSLAQAFETDRAIMKAFGTFLYYVLDGENQILSIEYLWALPDYPELIRAIRFLKLEQVGMPALLEKFRTLRMAELMVLIQYARDDELRKKLLELLQEKLQVDQALEQVGWDRLVEYVLEQKIEPLYDICEKRLQEHLNWGKERRQRYSVFEQSWRMLSYLWYLRGDYDHLFQEGHPYIQAVAYLEDGDYQDLDRAAQSWKKLAKESREPSAYLNWMLSYLRKLQDMPKTGAAARRELYQDIEQLRIEIESDAFKRWQEEDRLRYAEEIAFLETLTGKSETEAIHTAAETLRISEEQLQARWNCQVKSDAVQDTPVQLAPSAPFAHAQLAQAMQQFRVMSLKEKADCYFSSGGAPFSERSDITLILLEVFRTLYHLSNYGDKLVCGGTLYEDRCTQLFRECFNLNGSEWWDLIANDQQQTGSTGKVNQKGLPESAENDLLIKYKGYTCMMLEAMVLEYLDRGELEKHIKVIGDNIRNVPMVLLIYGNSMNSNALWQALCEYLHHEFSDIVRKYGVEVEPFCPFKNSKFYCPEQYLPLEELAGHSQVTYASHNGASAMPLIVVYADIGKRGHVRISKQVREKQTLAQNHA